MVSAILQHLLLQLDVPSPLERRDPEPLRRMKRGVAHNKGVGVRPGDGYAQQLTCQNVGRGVKTSHEGVLARREPAVGTLRPPQPELDTLGPAAGGGRRSR